METPDLVEAYCKKVGHLVTSRDISQEFDIDQAYIKRVLSKLAQDGRIVEIQFSGGHLYLGITGLTLKAPTFTELASTILRIGLRLNENLRSDTRPDDESFNNIADHLRTIANCINLFTAPSADDEEGW